MNEQIDPIKAANEAEMAQDQNVTQGAVQVSPDDPVTVTFTRGELEVAKDALAKLQTLPELQEGPLLGAIQMLSQALTAVTDEADQQISTQRGEDQNSPEALALEIGGMVNARR